MTASRLASRQRVAGLCIITGFFGLLLLGYAKVRPFEDTKTVWATFANAATITSTDRDVRVSGATVGRIGDIERVGDNARVELILEDSDIRVAEDATADLRPHLAFEGSSFVDLHPGSGSAPAFEDGDTIPVERTRNYVSVDKVLRVASAPTRAALKGDLRKLGESLQPEQQMQLQSAFKDQPELYTTLAPAARAARGVAGDELTGAVGGLSRTVDKLATRSEDFQPGLREAARSFVALRADGALHQALQSLPPALSALQTGGVDLRNIVDELEPFAADVQPALRELGPTQRQLRPLLRELTPVLRSARPTLSDVRTAVTAVGDASPTTLRVLRNVDPIYDPLKDRVLPALFEKTRLGATNYDQLIRGFATGFDGAISSLQTTEQSLGMGTGHGFKFNATAANVPLNGFPVSCTAVPQELRFVLSNLSLCGGP